MSPRSKLSAPSPNTVRLDECPEEILRCILQLVWPSDYYSLCLVNQRIRATAETFLYSNITLTWSKTETPPIIPFMQTLFRRPELAGYVDTIKFEGSDFDQDDRVDCWPPPHFDIGNANLDDFLAFAKRLDVRTKHLFPQDLLLGVMDAYVALLLAQLRNISCLSFDISYTRYTRLMDSVLESALKGDSPHCLIPRFKRLRHVIWTQDFLRLPVDWHPVELTRFFYLRNPQSITALGRTPIRFNRPRNSSDIFPTIREVAVRYMQEDYVGELLSATPNLERFTWTWNHDTRSTEMPPYEPVTIDLDEIGAHLSAVQRSLKSLCISAIYLYRNIHCFPNWLEVRGSLDVLASFERLEYLQLPMAFVWGFSRDTTRRLEDILPSSLVSLCLTDHMCSLEENDLDNQDLMRALESWLSGWKRQTPKLETLRLELKETEPEWKAPMRETLIQLGREAGIGVTIKKNPDSP